MDAVCVTALAADLLDVRRLQRMLDVAAAQAGARVGTVLMATLFGMALGGWMSGAIFDLTGSYRAAFLNGVAWKASAIHDNARNHLGTMVTWEVVTEKIAGFLEELRGVRARENRDPVPLRLDA